MINLAFSLVFASAISVDVSSRDNRYIAFTRDISNEDFIILDMNYKCSDIAYNYASYKIDNIIKLYIQYKSYIIMIISNIDDLYNNIHKTNYSSYYTTSPYKTTGLLLTKIF